MPQEPNLNSDFLRIAAISRLASVGSALRASGAQIGGSAFVAALREALSTLEASGAWNPASDIEAPLMSLIEAYPNPDARSALACLDVFATWPGGSGIPRSEPHGGGPVHAAASFPGDGAWLRVLASFGYAMDSPNRRGVTPLMLTARVGAAVNASILLEAGADPRAVDLLGRSVWKHGEPPESLTSSAKLDPPINPVHELLSVAIERGQIEKSTEQPAPRSAAGARL